jgi:PKD repeat protein
MKKVFSKVIGTVLLGLIVVTVIGQVHVVFAAKFNPGDVVEVYNTGGVGLRVRDATYIIADNVQISDISAEPYIFSLTALEYTISGAVRDKLGNPIPNVLIVAQDALTEIEVASATSNATGAYAMTVPSGTYNLIVTPPPESEFAPTTISNIEITQDSVIDIVLVRIEEVVTLSGVILDRDGNPIPNQYVYVFSGDISRSTLTDNQGLFSMQVPVGSYSIRIEGHYWWSGSEPVPSVPTDYWLYGKSTINITQDTYLTITLQNRFLSGKVDCEGRPVANTGIHVSGYTDFGDFYGWFESWTTSDAGGKFNIAVFTCSNVYLEAYPPELYTPVRMYTDVTNDKTVLIALAYKTGVLPTADFTWSPETPEVGQLVTFDASPSMPGSGIIIKHKWSFGDGTYAIGKVVTHSYSSPGVYTVTLNVTNSKGLWSIIQKQIEVVELPGPKAPIANFTYSPLNPTVGQEVTFNASNSYDPDGVIVAYSWDFGDGSSEQGKIVTHYYTQEGSYKVTLTVIDNDGKTGSISQTVTVVKPLDVQVETSGLVIKAMSPVDLVVIDPDYLVISKEFSEIPDAVYMEIDLNGDGSLDDYVFIPKPKIGQYIITVIPEQGVDPTATYTLVVATNDATILLAKMFQ